MPDGHDVAEMLEAMARLAMLRSSVFAFGTSPDAWAKLLLTAGYKANETVDAIDSLVLRKRAEDRIELGDLTAEIEQRRAWLVGQLSPGGPAERRRRYEALFGRKLELVGGGDDDAR